MKQDKCSQKEVNSKVRSDSVFRKRIWSEFLKHVKNGKSLDSYGPLGWSTFQVLMKDYPLDCPQEELESAQRVGKDMWETIGEKQAKGSCLGNSRTWYYNMSNRYGWSDRIESKVDSKHSGTVNIVNYSKQPKDAS